MFVFFGVDIMIDKILFKIAAISEELSANNNLRVRFRRPSSSTSTSRSRYIRLIYRAMKRVGKLRTLRRKELVIMVED